MPAQGERGGRSDSAALEQAAAGGGAGPSALSSDPAEPRWRKREVRPAGTSPSKEDDDLTRSLLPAPLPGATSVPGASQPRPGKCRMGQGR